MVQWARHARSGRPQLRIERLETMKHVKVISKAPVCAALNDIPVEDMITFITAILAAIADLLGNKETPA